MIAAVALPQRLYGVDFTSRPTPRKPITVCEGYVAGVGVLEIFAIHRLRDFPAFEHFLQTPGPWLAAFDFPFGLPRELVMQLGWPAAWPALIRHYAGFSRAELRTTFRQFCNGRPTGQKFAHRAADLLARSSPSMKWVNPPVAYMLQEGAARLLAAGVHLPGLHAGDTARIALEGYPALVARAVIGNASYKSDEKARQTAERRINRVRILGALLQGIHPLGIRLQCPPDLLVEMQEDGSADLLDATLCAIQAAWAATRKDAHFGLPEAIDPLEGWIVSV